MHENDFYFKFDFAWFPIIDTLPPKKKLILYEWLKDFVCTNLEEKASWNEFASGIKDTAVRVAFVAIVQDININD